MSRSFFVNGETMVAVQGPVGSLIASPQQLGLSIDPIRVTLIENQEILYTDPTGKNNPVDEQVFGGTAIINMRLVHFDPVFLAECIRLAWPSSTAEGLLGRAGARRGGDLAAAGAIPPVLLSAGNSFITLNLSSPVALLPYNFPSTHLHEHPVVFPVGTEKSVVDCVWRAIAVPNNSATDPWNGGLGTLGNIIYNRLAMSPAANPT